MELLELTYRSPNKLKIGDKVKFRHFRSSWTGTIVGFATLRPSIAIVEVEQCEGRYSHSIDVLRKIG